MPSPKQHRWRIADREYERHDRRRGRRHAYEVLDGGRTALVVVDMVPFFVEVNPYALGIVPRIDELADAVRSAGGTVAWVLPGPPAHLHVEFFGADVAARYAASGGDGPLGDRLWHEFTPAPDDLLVEKSSPSAFFPGRCDLADRLGERGIDTVLIAGTVANVCCESSARDASTLGFRVVMVADATAAGSDAELNATLHTIYRSFGDVRSTSELVGLLTAAV